MSAQNFYKKIQESALGFVLDKVVSVLGGIAAAVIVGIIVPVTDTVFQLYLPLDSFLEKYVYYCIGVFILTIIIWVLIWRRPLLQRLAPYVISLIAVVVSGMMRSEVLFPNVIGIQFVLFFGGILLLCEALLVHIVLLALGLIEKLKS